jgi:hypothetical protein
MGVDYYNCTGCDEIFTTCGDYQQCCKCHSMFCEGCTEVTKVAVEDCESCECEEDCECEELSQWKEDVEENCDQECKEYHTVCLECQKPPPEPWAVDDYELLQLLAEKAGYKSVEEARTAEEEKQKQQMLKRKREDKEEEEKPKKRQR